MPKLDKLFVLLLLCTFPFLAQAGVLDGQSGTLYYDFPDLGTHFSADAFTAPATVITLTYGPDLVNTIGGNDVNITFGNIGYDFAPGNFNGEDFYFPTLIITGVIYSSNFTSDWSWDANNLIVNWQGLTPDSSSYVDFTVSATATPEPGTLVLLGLGGAVLGLLRRRRSA